VGNQILSRNQAAGLRLGRRSLLTGGFAAAAIATARAETGSPGDTLDEIVARGSIRIGMYADYAPYSFLDGGKIRGTDAGVAEIIAKALGVKAELELRGADENVDGDLRSHVWRGPLTGGDVVNVMLHMPIDRELGLRNDMVLMGGAYASEKTVLSWSKSQLGDIPTMTDFTEHRIAVENDSIADFYLGGFAGGAIIPNIDHKPSIIQAVEAMQAGEVAAVLGPMAQIEYALAKTADKRENFGVGQTTPPGLAQGAWSYGFAVRMNYHDLFYAVEDAIVAAAADGRLKAVYEDLGLTYNPPQAARE
jgi:ABC-type amino acid transport substrate-binding protein